MSTRNNTSNFPIPSNCAISCERDRTPIALSFLERFRTSDPPAHSLTEQNSNLFLIPQGFRISDPPSRQGTKMDICSWSSKYSEFLTEQNSNLFLIPQGFRISDPPSRQGTKIDICSWSSKYSEFLIPQAT